MASQERNPGRARQEYGDRECSDGRATGNVGIEVSEEHESGESNEGPATDKTSQNANS